VSGFDELTREELIELVIELHKTVEHQVERIAQLEEEIARLSGPKAKPEWVKPNAAKKKEGPRKKRMQSYARQALAATQVLYHAVDECPECGRELTGGSVKWKRQVIDIPRTPIEVTDHLFVERYARSALFPTQEQCWEMLWWARRR
jgi:uncharacterized small protein (DUF1192 family)